MELLSGIMLFSVCSASLTPEATFWYDRPTYWWKANYTASDECSSLMFCSVAEKPKSFFSNLLKTDSYFPMMSSNITLPVIKYMFPRAGQIQRDNKSINLPVIAVMTSPRIISPVAPPVNVTFHYQSFCSECKDKFLHQILPAYSKLASTRILNIELVLSENKRELHTNVGNYSLSCQHGSAKRLGNRIESCVIKYSSAKLTMAVIHCLEFYGPTLVNAQYCTSVYNVPWNPVHNCFHGNEGEELVHKMADETRLGPSQQQLPWFSINGRYSNELQKQLSTDMLASVCKHYTGVKPPAC